MLLIKVYQRSFPHVMCRSGDSDLCAKMCVVAQRVLLMDEISTGLDSATTYTVTEFLRHTTHYLHLTTLVSLLQPPPEVFFLFEDIILLSDGCAQPGNKPVTQPPSMFPNHICSEPGSLSCSSPSCFSQAAWDAPGMSAGLGQASCLGT